MFRYNVNNINVRKENIISVCVPIKELWRHSWRQKAIFPKSIIWCLLTHQACKEGRFSQPLWFCDWYRLEKNQIEIWKQLNKVVPSSPFSLEGIQLNFTAGLFFSHTDRPIKENTYTCMCLCILVYVDYLWMPPYCIRKLSESQFI